MSYYIKSSTEIVNEISYSFPEFHASNSGGLTRPSAPNRYIKAYIYFIGETSPYVETISTTGTRTSDEYTIIYGAISGTFKFTSTVEKPIAQIDIVCTIDFTDSANAPYLKHQRFGFTSYKCSVKGNSVTLTRESDSSSHLKLYKSNDLTDPVVEKEYLNPSVEIKNLNYSTEYTYIIISKVYNMANIYSFTTDDKPSTLYYAKVNGEYKQGALYAKVNNEYKEVALAAIKDNDIYKTV